MVEAPHCAHFRLLRMFAVVVVNCQIEVMLDPGEDTDYEQSPMRTALNTAGGSKVFNLVGSKTRHLKVGSFVWNYILTGL